MNALPIISPFRSTPTMGAVAARATESRPESPVDRVETTPPPAVTGPTLGATRPVAATPWRSLALAITVAGSLLAPGLSSVAAAQTAPIAQVMSAQQPTAQSRDTLIERLLTPPAGAPQTSASDLQKLRASINDVPTHALDLLVRHGTRIVVIQKGQTPTSAGITRVIDVAQDYANLDSLTARARGATQRVDGEMAARLAPLRQTMAAEEAKAAKLDETPASFKKAEAALEAALGQRDGLNVLAVQESTHGLLEPALSETGNGMFGHVGRVTPMSLNELAQEAGATTPDQVKEYVGLVKAINGDRIGQAQALYGQQDPRAAFEDRPMMVYDAQLLVPSFHYEGGQRITSLERASAQVWKNDQVLGESVYGRGGNVVVVRSDALEPRADGHNVVQHELGHAYEAARLDEASPSAAVGYARDRDEAWLRISSNRSHPYLHKHAGEGANEMSAQTFADVISHHDGPLQKADPAWLQAFQNGGYL